MFYLYGKNIQNLNWEFIGVFNKDEAEKYIDENDDRYVSFQISLKELDL